MIPGSADSALALEAYLARLLLEPELRARFAAAPAVEAQQAGLSEPDGRALAAMDLEALELAAVSFAHKRARGAKARSPAHPNRSSGLLRWFLHWCRWRR